MLFTKLCLWPKTQGGDRILLSEDTLAPQNYHLDMIRNEFLINFTPESVVADIFLALCSSIAPKRTDSDEFQVENLLKNILGDRKKNTECIRMIGFESKKINLFLRFGNFGEAMRYALILNLQRHDFSMIRIFFTVLIQLLEPTQIDLGCLWAPGRT